jgi:hypothetical protein
MMTSKYTVVKKFMFSGINPKEKSHFIKATIMSYPVTTLVMELNKHIQNVPYSGNNFVFLLILQ